jgi:hypothetical protein
MDSSAQYTDRHARWLTGLIVAILFASLPARTLSGGDQAPEPKVTQKITDGPVEPFLTYGSSGFKEGDYRVIASTTCSPVRRVQDEAETIAYLKKEFQGRELDLDELIDALIARNRKPEALTVVSDQKKGYVVDTDGVYAAYHKEGGGGWKQWYADHPHALGMLRLSVPVYDKSREILLVHIEVRIGDKSGKGYVCAYEYKQGKLRLLGQVLVWIT